MQITSSPFPTSVSSKSVHLLLHQECMNPWVLSYFLPSFKTLLCCSIKSQNTFIFFSPPPTISTSHAPTPSFTEICRYWFTHNLNHSLSYLTDFWQPEWSLKAHWHTLLVRQQCASHVSASPLMTNRNPAELCCGRGPHFSPHHLMPLFAYVLFSCQCWGLQHVQGAQPGVWQEPGGFITPSAFSKIQPINLTVWTAS